MRNGIRMAPLIFASITILVIIAGCNRSTTAQKIAMLQGDARNLAQQAVSDQQTGKLGSAQLKYREAVGAYHQIIALEPTSYEAWLNLGILYNFFGDYEKADESLDKALEINPDKGKAYFYKGFMQLEKGDPREAEIAFKMSIDRDADYAPAQFFYGKVEFQLGEQFRAKTALERYLELEPDGTYSDLAKGYIELLPESVPSLMEPGILPAPQEPVESENDNEEPPIQEPAVAPEPEPEPVEEDPEVVDAPTPEPEPALPPEAVIEETPDPEPEPVEPEPVPEPEPVAPLKYADHIEIGQFALAVEDYEGALESFKRAYQQEPLFKEVNYLLGKTYRALGDFDKGIDHLKVALSRSADDPGSLREMGYCYEGKGEIETALGYFDRYLAIEEREDIRAHVESLRAG